MTASKKNPAAVALGKMGGKARAKTLTAARRREIGSLAIKARWAKAKAKAKKK